MENMKERLTEMEHRATKCYFHTIQIPVGQKKENGSGRGNNKETMAYHFLALTKTYTDSENPKNSEYSK